MNFQEIYEAVLDNTKRFDKSVMVKREINTSIKYMQASGRYPRDLVELTYTPSDLLVTQSIALPSRFRAVGYVRPNTFGSKGLTSVDPLIESALNPGYYISGDALLVRMQVAADYINWGYYQWLPPLVNDADENWLTNFCDYFLIDYTTVRVNAKVSDEAAARLNQQYAMGAIQAAINEMAFPETFSVASGRG